jgi:hypothetical protein
MKIVYILATPFALAFATTALADSTRTKPVPVHAAGKIPPSVDRGKTTFLVLRQDLFDRNNPNNQRSDYHSPPAQPGQF